MSDNHINNFPNELLSQLFGYLDSISLNACMRVCRRWRVLVQNVGGSAIVPRVMQTIFANVDYSTSLELRKVCKLWKDGMDKVTITNNKLIRVQTEVNFDVALELMHSPRKTNPFPFRAVRTCVILNEKKPLIFRRNRETDSIEKYGVHIKYLALTFITCSIIPEAMHVVIKKIQLMLVHLPNIEGLSIDVSYLYGDNCSDRYHGMKPSRAALIESLHHDISIPILKNLKALRLVAYNFGSAETEWLYSEILRNAPNLEMFDPDFTMGICKFRKVLANPAQWPFHLSSLRLAVCGQDYDELLQLLAKGNHPLERIHFDIFNMKAEILPSGETVISIVNACSSLKSLALNLYRNTRTKGIVCTNMLGSKYPRRVSSVGLMWKACAPFNLQKKMNWQRVSNSTRFSISRRPRMCQLQTLVLRGLIGSLEFLKELRQLETLIVLDYEPQHQIVFNSEEAFFHYLPNLKHLHTPPDMSVEMSFIKEVITNKKFAPLYWW